MAYPFHFHKHPAQRSTLIFNTIDYNLDNTYFYIKQLHSLAIVYSIKSKHVKLRNNVLNKVILNSEGRPSIQT